MKGWFLVDTYISTYLLYNIKIISDLSELAE